MHDFCEGVANYTITAILKYLIYEKEYFKLSIFNSRRDLFNYGHLEGSNKPPVVTKDHILKKKMAKIIGFRNIMPYKIFRINDWRSGSRR